MAGWQYWALEQWQAWRIELDWADSTESDLAGYNVYRASVSGGPYTKLNTSLVLTSAYIDTDAQDAATYYYVVTAVDTHGFESGYSGEISKTASTGTTAPIISVGMIGIRGAA